MSELTLNYTDDFNEIKSMNTVSEFNIILASDGTSYDLSEAKDLSVKVGNSSGYISEIPIDVNKIENKVDGLLTINLDDTFMKNFPPDIYHLEIWVGTDKGRLIFPSKGVLPFTINGNIMSNFEAVSKITLYQFQDNFDDLKRIIIQNKAYLDKELTTQIDRANQLKQDFINESDKKQKHFDNDLDIARKGIQEEREGLQSYLNDISKNAKNSFDDFTNTRKNEINNRIEELQTTVNNQQRKYQENINDLNNDVEKHKATYNNLSNRTESLLKQLEQNENSVHASINDINNVKKTAEEKAGEAQTEAIKQSNKYTDQRYEDLQSKNGVSYEKLKDYQKPNLADINSDNWIDTGNNSNQTMLQTGTIHFEKGKDYWLSIQYKDGTWKENPSIMIYKNSWDSFNGDYWCISFDYSKEKTDLNPTFHYVPEEDEDVTLRITRWNDVAENVYIRGFTITQSTQFVPYEIAEKNKKALIAASKDELNSTKTEFIDKTNILEKKINNKAGSSSADDVEVDKAYQNAVNTSKRYTNKMLNRFSKEQEEAKSKQEELNNQFNKLENKYISLDSGTTEAFNKLNDDITKIKLLKDKESAVREAKFSNKPLLCVYPDGFQVGKALGVSAIYSFGDTAPNNYKNIDGIINDGESLKGTDREGVYLVFRGSKIQDSPFNSSEDYLVKYVSGSNFAWVDAIAWKNGEFYNQQAVGKYFIQGKDWTYGRFPTQYNRANLNSWNPKSHINNW